MMATLAPTMAQTPADGAHLATAERRLTTNLDLAQVSVTEASLTVLKHFGHPGGIVTILSGGDCVAKERRSLFLPWGLDLGSALDIIVPSASSSSWTMDNHVVNILPRKNLPEVMSVRIESFQWNTRDHVRVVVGQLFVLEQVTDFLAKHAFASGPQFIAAPQGASRPAFGVPEQPTGQQYSLTGSTLLGALNRVAASYGGAIWMYTQSHCEGKREYYIFVQP